MSLDEQGRPEPPWAGGERETLIGFLEFQRATLAWKTQGLDGDVLDGVGLTSTLAPSTMTLGGILKHLAWVEDFWFSRRLLGGEAAAIWQGADWTAEPDWEWTSAASDSPGELQRIWSDAVEQSRATTAQALAAEARGAGVTAMATAGVTAALSHLRDTWSGPAPRILICGSLYLAGEVLADNGTPPA